MTDTTDPISNAVLTPEGSRFIRELLNRAIENSEGASDSWKATAQALLANVLMNDFLNGWNPKTGDLLGDAKRAVNEAGNSALALHAQGLIARAEGDHDAAFTAFDKAIGLAPEFVRARVQVANQMVLRGENTNEARRRIQEVIDQNPHHPASGYFYWALGRAYFVDEDWQNAVKWLSKSVDALPTVPYNRAYLAAAAQQHAKDAAGAIVLPPETPNSNLEEARKRLRDGLRDATAKPNS